MIDGPRQTFRLFDSVCLIVGIIVGAGIYETPPQIAGSVGGPTAVLGLWIVGGLISLAGALCYTELATTYPRDGGDVIYLTKAYGRWAGFLFGWMQITIVRPGDISALAFVFSSYAMTLGTGLDAAQLASLAVILFSVINLIGVQQARWTQNGMTVIKIVGLVALIAVGFMGPRNANAPAPVEMTPGIPVGVALVIVLFCYGGWNEMVYIAAEVQNPRKNIFRAMMIGMAGVTVVYLLANMAFMTTLGHAGLARSSAVAVDVVAQRLPSAAQVVVAALIAFSALGALNGQILTGARVSYSAGTEHYLFRRLGRWNNKRQTPVAAILLQMVISVTLINLLRAFADTLLYMASSVYTFYFFSSLAIVVLRRKHPETHRPFRVPAYPVTVVLFLLACVLMIRSAVAYRPLIAGVSLLILLAGVPLYFLSESLAAADPGHQKSPDD